MMVTWYSLGTRRVVVAVIATLTVAPVEVLDRFARSKAVLVGVIDGDPPRSRRQVRRGGIKLDAEPGESDGYQ